MVLGTQVGLSPGDFVLDGYPALLPKGGGAEPLPNFRFFFGPCLLWPNDRMDQDGTWHGGKPQPRRLCVRWGPSPLPQKGTQPPIFGLCLLPPNGCMDHVNAIWYGGIGLGPDNIVLDVIQAPASLQKGADPPPQFPVHVYSGQTAGWIKIALGTEVELGTQERGQNPPPPIYGPFYSAPQCSHCKRCTSYGNCVRPSVCLSVCPSVTRRYCVKTTACSTVQFALSYSTRSPAIAEGPRDAGVPVEIW